MLAVKEETKWRYRMYKDWLRFLEDGFGDAFDVVEDAFQEGQDGGETTRQPRNPTAIREKLVSRDDPSYSISGSGGDSASSIMGDGLKGAPVPIPVLKSEVKKVRAMLDNAGSKYLRTLLFSNMMTIYPLTCTSSDSEEEGE